jgi:hypothetical protein
MALLHPTIGTSNDNFYLGGRFLVNALKELFFLIIDIVQIYFATIKLNKYFTCLI